MNIQTGDIITLDWNKHEVRPDILFSWDYFLMQVSDEGLLQRRELSSSYNICVDRYKAERLKKAILAEWLEDEIKKYLGIDVQARVDERTWEEREMEYQRPEEWEF